MSDQMPHSNYDNLAFGNMPNGPVGDILPHSRYERLTFSDNPKDLSLNLPRRLSRKAQKNILCLLFGDPNPRPTRLKTLLRYTQLRKGVEDIFGVSSDGHFIEILANLYGATELRKHLRDLRILREPPSVSDKVPLSGGDSSDHEQNLLWGSERIVEQR